MAMQGYVGLCRAEYGYVGLCRAMYGLDSPQTSFGVRLSRIHFSPRTSA